MKKLLYSSLAALLFICCLPSDACTSMIVSGKVTASGRPVMYKNRDTGELNNRIEFFNGPKYTFIGLVNSPVSKKPEVWAGTNSAGFSIMNTASYNIKDDDVPSKNMDKEGEIMYEALGVCATVDEFEQFLSEHKKPMGVESNFGVIDADGGAAYFEVNNTKWVKYDVNDPAVAPRGYRVQTNFSESGSVEKYEGWERYLTASATMNDIFTRSPLGIEIDHEVVMNEFSRSYRHYLLGIDYVSNPPASGVAVDQDFIPRKSTSAVVVFEGVKPGENPLHTIMWTAIGYPTCSLMLPLFVGDGDHIPSYMKKRDSSNKCDICNFSLKLKNEDIFNFKISNGSKYFNVGKSLQYREKVQKVESKINKCFGKIYSDWVSGNMSDQDFYKAYETRSASYYECYLAEFAEND